MTSYVCHGSAGVHIRKHRDVGAFFADVFAAFAPRVECVGDLALEQAELQWDIGRIEPFGDFIRPGQLRHVQL